MSPETASYVAESVFLAMLIGIAVSFYGLYLAGALLLGCRPMPKSWAQWMWFLLATHAALWLPWLAYAIAMIVVHASHHGIRPSIRPLDYIGTTPTKPESTL